MTAVAVGTSPRTSTAGRAGVAGWTGPLRRSAWTVALVTALGAALGLLLVVHRDHRYVARRHGRRWTSSAGTTAERQAARAIGGRPGRVRAGPGRGGHGCWTCPWRGCDRSSRGRSWVTVRRSSCAPRHATRAGPRPSPRPRSPSPSDLQSSQGSLVSPLPAFHAGAIDGSASATGPGWLQVTLAWGAVAMALAVAGVYLVAYANGWAPETARRAGPPTDAGRVAGLSVVARQPAHESRPPRVLHLCTRYLSGGTDRRVRDMVAALPEAEHHAGGGRRLVARAGRVPFRRSVSHD